MQIVLKSLKAGSVTVKFSVDYENDLGSGGRRAYRWSSSSSRDITLTVID